MISKCNEYIYLYKIICVVLVISNLFHGKFDGCVKVSSQITVSIIFINSNDFLLTYRKQKSGSNN